MGARVEWPKTWDGLMDLVKELELHPEAYLNREELRQALAAVQDDDSAGLAKKIRALRRVGGLVADGEKLEVTPWLVDREESERQPLLHEAAYKHANSRRALDQNRADQLAGKTKAARLRAERDRDIEEFIDQAHAANVSKKTILERLVEGWGAEAEGGPSQLMDAGYALSTEVLRKMESRLRRAKGKP